MARIELKDIRKTLSSEGRERSTFRIEGLNLEIPDGKTMAVLGPSGCGKSTLLRIIAGLVGADSGQVLYDGVDVASVPAAGRGIGMVFQNYALYPNFDTRTNVLSYFMFRKKTPELEREKEELYRRTSELLGVEIESLMGRMPRGLSGGERQRVAIARCITREPKLFLLDEPFSSLDAKLREKYRVQLRVLLKQFNVTTVYVTHDQVEALILADLIALMRDGRIEQVGSAQDIYDEPANLFAADFINFEPEMPAINLIDGELVSPELSSCTIGARPERITVIPSPNAPAAPSGPARTSGSAPEIEGVLVDQRPVPLRSIDVLCVRCRGCDVYVRAPLGSSYAAGSRLRLSLGKCQLFDKASGIRLRNLG